jgi:hypothetical protein
MKRVAVCTFLVVLLGVALSLAVGPAAQGAKPKAGRLRHVVMFKFKDSATPEQIKKVEDAFRALPSKIPQVAGFEWGTDESPEHLAQGFTHCYFLTFRNQADRDTYLKHPAHKAFGQVLHPYLDKVLVVDYVARD